MWANTVNITIDRAHVFYNAGGGNMNIFTHNGHASANNASGDMHHMFQDVGTVVVHSETAAARSSRRMRGDIKAAEVQEGATAFPEAASSVTAVTAMWETARWHGWQCTKRFRRT